MHCILPLALLLTLCACVTEVVEAEQAQMLPMQSVEIPLEGVDEPAPVVAFYDNVLGQMQEAVRERDVEQLEQLIRRYDRPDAPDYAQEQFEVFAQASLAIRFELSLRDGARLELPGDTQVLGEGVRAVLVVSEPVGLPKVSLRGADTDSPTRFRATFELEDHDVYGNRSKVKTSLHVEPERELDLHGDAARLPFEIPAYPTQAAYRTVRVTVDLLPGVVRIGDEEVPVRQTRCFETDFRMFPPGIASLQRAPLTTLRNAIQEGDARYFRHVFLAGLFVPEERRSEAESLLAEGLRSEVPGLSRVCAATLAEMTGKDLAADDRAAWIDWWNARKR